MDLGCVFWPGSVLAAGGQLAAISCASCSLLLTNSLLHQEFSDCRVLILQPAPGATSTQAEGTPLP